MERVAHLEDEEAAKRLGVSTQTLWRWGKALEEGRDVRPPRKSTRRALERLLVAPEPAIANREAYRAGALHAARQMIATMRGLMREVAPEESREDLDGLLQEMDERLTVAIVRHESATQPGEPGAT